MSIAQLGLVALDILPWWVRLQLDVAEFFALMAWTRCPIIFFLFSTRCRLFRVTCIRMLQNFCFLELGLDAITPDWFFVMTVTLIIVVGNKCIFYVFFNISFLNLVFLYIYKFKIYANVL